MSVIRHNSRGEVESALLHGPLPLICSSLSSTKELFVTEELSPAVAMAPTKEPGGLDNLAFDVSAMTYLYKINTPMTYLAISI